MKKKIWKNCVAVLMGLLCLATFTGCGDAATESGAMSKAITEMTSTEDATEEDVNAQEEKASIDLSDANLVAEGKLTVGMVIDYPPFEYYPPNGDTPIGVDVDIINAVAKELGLQVDIKNVPWDEALFTNMSNEYDVVCSAVTITEDRLGNMIFSDAYIDSYQSVVVRKDSKITIDSFEDLDGLKIAVQKDTVSDELMQKYVEDETVQIELKANEVATDCFEQLKAGEVDAVVCDSTVTKGQVARNQDSLEEAYRDESKVEKFAIAINKENPGLQAAINEALHKLQETGTDKAIINRWFSR